MSTRSGKSFSLSGSRKAAPKIMLLSMQRGQNLGVLLANLKMSPSQVRQHGALQLSQLALLTTSNREGGADLQSS